MWTTPPLDEHRLWTPLIDLCLTLFPYDSRTTCAAPSGLHPHLHRNSINRTIGDGRRNVGNFRAGEFHGEVLTTYPDGQAIYGRYVDGRRDGTFVIIRIDGSHVEASYRDGTLVSQLPRGK